MFLTIKMFVVSLINHQNVITLHSQIYNVFVKPNDQSDASISFGMARKRRQKANVFVKPNDQSDASISFGMARKRRQKANVFVKPEEQSEVCSDSALASSELCSPELR